MSGVICHHGVSGLGGHYTCYCYNANTGQWFHYDDSNVRLVDAATVASAEAYVLFYKKDPPAELEQSRAKVEHGMKKQEREESVITSYIATAWLTKFLTLSHPGPIDNSSVICRHGAVLPSRAENVSSLVTPVPSKVWSYLHERWKIMKGNYPSYVLVYFFRFGGGAAVTSLSVCAKCEEEERLEAKQKEFELNQFKVSLIH